MEKNQLIDKVKNLLEEISPETRNETAQRVIQDLSRALNLIKSESDALLFKKYAVDLSQLYSSEIAFQKMNKNKGSTLSDGFFKSFEILKKDILKALENATR